MLWQQQRDIDEEVILGLILACMMTRKYLPDFTTQKSPGIENFFGGEEHFGLKTGIDFAYRVWFSRELPKCMNVFIISASND